MLTQTTEMAINGLLYLALAGQREPVPLQQIAQELDVSPSYLVKTMGHLIRAGIIRSHRGVQGGVTLARPLENVSLLEVVEACQGKFLGSYCDGKVPSRAVCAFHRVMQEVHEATVETLARWTMADLMDKPVGRTKGEVVDTCKLSALPLKLVGAR